MKTTRKDFEAFKTEFLKWRTMLGLTDWRVCFYHERLDRDTAAQITPQCDAKLVGVSLGFICDRTPGEVGRHEALELLLADLEDVARSRYIRPDDVVEKRHAVIRRLEHLFDEAGVAKS